eukprot:247193_1
MAEMYETLQTQTKNGRYAVYLLVFLVVLLLALTSFTVYYVVKNPPNDAKSVTLCTTAACVSLADEIQRCINTSVDPCDDFFHYSCDGYIARHSWRLIDESEYDQFSEVEELLKQNFLDEMFWDINAQLTAPDAVQKARAFYESCYQSTTTKDDIQATNVMKELIQTIDFSISGQDWNHPNVSAGFHDAIAYLNQRDWNSLFQMGVFYKHDVSLQQNSDFWNGLSYVSYDNQTFCDVINTTYVPLYVEVFNMTAAEARDAGLDVCQFTKDVSAIGNYPSSYMDPTTYSTYFTSTNLSQFNALVPDTNVLNFTNIMYKTFESTNVSDIYYFGAPDIDYFKSLSTLLSNTDPSIVQLFLFTNVLWYFLDYENSWQQAVRISRSDFCYDWTIDQFPFVFGYITGNTLYSDEKFEAVTDFATSIQDAMLQLVEDASWLDTESRERAIKKAAQMDLYVGYPKSVFTADGINTYYEDLQEMDTKSWLSNVETMNQWFRQQTIESFASDAFPILDDWPILFSQRSTLSYWMTGVNAFYYPGPSVDGANFFTIPTTITQHPLFHAEYPSAANYGSLGSICGHEMSHGFDVNGFQYDFNGSEVESILSDGDLGYYQDAIQCYVNQYNALPLRRKSELMDDGTGTQTENVADNVGLKAAYVAWRKHREDVKENTALPGIELNEKQLFFWSWAHLWCDVNRPSALDNYTYAYSPHYTRVIGVLQNSQEFADAFECTNSDFMSPDNRCTVW